MGFSEAVRTGFRKYAVFSGRASRREYWWWAVFAFLVWFLAFLLDVMFFPGSIRSDAYLGLLSGIAGVVLFLPNLAAAVRRLHDTDRSGWWWLIALIPIIGAIVLVVFLASSGTRGVNRFGPPPARTSALPVPGNDVRPRSPGPL
jgi:uncharacterized membrane protein YhaH (DUF805 family)